MTVAARARRLAEALDEQARQLQRHDAALARGGGLKHEILAQLLSAISRRMVQLARAAALVAVEASRPPSTATPAATPTGKAAR